MDLSGFLRGIGMLNKIFPTLLRYGMAALFVLVALLVTLALWPVVQLTPFVLFFVAILASAWYGGLWTGLLAAVLAAVAYDFFFIPPVYTWATSISDAMRIGLFMLVSILISLVSAARKQAVEALSKSEELHRLILKNISDAVFITKDTGEFMYICPNADVIFGYSPQEVQSFGNIAKLLGKDTFDLNELDRVGEIPNVEHQISDKAGSHHTLLVNAKRVSVDGGTTLYTCRDITMWKAAEERLLELGAIVESSDDAILSMTLYGKIISWNTGAQKVYGYFAEEVINRPVSLLVPPGRSDELLRMLETIKAGENREPIETVHRRKDHSLIDISLTISPIKDSSGKITGASAIGRNIFERKQLEEERIQLAREQAANRAKDEFLAIVSHELRTPLNSIVGWAHILRQSSVDEATRVHAIEIIERSAKSQGQLIADLLDDVRRTTGKIRLDVCTVGLASVTEAAVDVVRPIADAKSIDLRVVIDPSVPSVLADPDRLKQVVWNLLTNAIKFTPKGGLVELRVERAGANARIMVKDTGCGISAESLPHVFDRYYQDKSTDKHKGLGLGLAIVHHLVDLHGGTIRVESAGKGQGATFIVEFPLMVASDLKQQLETARG
jgi:PAS domain S-box-containing protein